jgi:hypothetical protein
MVFGFLIIIILLLCIGSEVEKIRKILERDDK